MGGHGMDPACRESKLDPATCWSTSNWPLYVQELYDPSLDEMSTVAEPEIVSILAEGLEGPRMSCQRYPVR